MKANGILAVMMAAMVGPTARKSSGDGRTGTSTKSAASMTSRSHCGAAGDVSIMHTSNCVVSVFSALFKVAGVGSRFSIEGVSASRASHQLRSEAYDSTKHTLTGESACLRHLFELSADYEAMQHTLVSLIAAEGGTLPMSTLWCFVAGLTCLFRRFFGYTTVPTRGVPSGTHPDPSYRMSMLLRGMSGFLCSNSLKQYVPWIREESDFFAVTNHATVSPRICNF